MQQRAMAIAFHCSGANAAQWRPLAAEIGDEFDIVTPEHIGCKSRGAWHGQTAFSLAHEAEPTIELIDQRSAPVHIVGHSYGGAVALHVALQRPEKVASLSLYEPSAFYLLEQLGEKGKSAREEISAIANQVASFVSCGNYRAAAETFVEYWNGPGSWDAMHKKVQDALVGWTPKAPLDFHALFHEPATLAAVAELKVPSLIMRGQYAPISTRTISDTLSSTLTSSRLEAVNGAGHMGPLTHGEMVSRLIADHVRASNTTTAIARQEKSKWRQLGGSSSQGWRLAS